MTRWILLAACLLAVAGCKTLQPEYPVTSVAFDERLVGAWEYVQKDDADDDGVKDADDDAEDDADEEGDEDGEMRLVLRAVDLPVHQGRIDTRVVEERTPATQHVRAYTGELTLGKTSYDVHVYLLSVRGQTLMGLQVTDEQLAKGGPGFLVAPIHILLRTTIEPDHFTLTAPKNGFVGWMPNVRWLDGEGGKATGEGTRLTASIDRLLEYMNTHAGDEGFWDDDAAEFRRVAK